MNKLLPSFWLIGLFLLGVLSACSDPAEDTSAYYFKQIVGEEDKLPTTLLSTTAGESFQLAFDCGQDWTASVLDAEAESWLHFSPAEGGKGENRITLTVDPYTGDEDRTSQVMILAKTLGKKITVYQTGKKTEDARAKRSVLVYMAAENTLGSYVGEDLYELIEGAASMPERSNLLVYVDDNKMPRIYQIGLNDVAEMDTIRVESYTTNLDSGKEETLEKVLNFMKQKYPADGYGLTIWSHGEGWEPASTRWIGVDNNQNSYSTNTGTNMNISDLATAVKNSVGQLDFIFFDACFMQTVEVAYELRNVVKYVIASPCEIPGPGAPYHKVVAAMFDQDLSRGGIANEYVTYYKNIASAGGSSYGAVLSTVDCSQLQALATATQPLTTAYFQKGATLSSDGWTHYGFSKSQASYDRSYIYLDFKQAMQQTLSEADYNTWKLAFEKAVVTYSATNYWYTSSKSQTVPLDVENTGGLAWSVPTLIEEGSSALTAFKKTSWYSAAWSSAGF